MADMRPDETPEEWIARITSGDDKQEPVGNFSGPTYEHFKTSPRRSKSAALQGKLLG